MLGRIEPLAQMIAKKLSGKLRPETQLLLFSNLIVLILAMAQGWDIVPLIWIYWCQNVIIGFFNWRRMKQLKQFSTNGLKINGKRVDPTESTKKWLTRFFLFHYGLFQFFYFLFLMIITEELPVNVVLSAIVGITFFLLNHFFSYRHSLQKDLSSVPDLAVMAFYPYARVIPMHLVIFIGYGFGRGSRIELFFFLLLKIAVDLLMHVLQYAYWDKQRPLDKSL